LEDIMIDLDDMLNAAGTRAYDATADLTLPGVPRPSRPTGMYAGVGAVATLAVVAGAFAVNSGGGGVKAGKVPQSFLSGAHGTEIVMKQIDDGDKDPQTITLDAGPAGQVKLYPATAETTAITVAFAVGSEGSTPPSVLIEGTCLETASGGLCPMNVDVPDMMIAPRSGEAAVTVYGLPSKVVAVAFTSGTERYWTRPFQGVVVFPFSEAASHEVRTDAYAADDTIIQSFENVSDELTTAEVAAKAVTTQTDEMLATGWFVPNYTPLAPGAMGEFARYRGRTSKTGFTGPFTAQGVSVCAPGSDECQTDRGIWLVTVNSDRNEEIRRRLASLGGNLRTIEPAIGTTVLVWSDTSAPKDKVDAIVAALVARPIDSQAGGQVLDTPRSWQSENPPPAGQVIPDAILGDNAGELGGLDVVAQSDDLGVVRFALRVAPHFANSALVGDAKFPPALPRVGEFLYSNLYAVPVETDDLVITLSDGSTVHPTLLDVRPIAPARLFYVAQPSTPMLSIAKVDVTRA
jgi:hypothetical protein